MSNEKEPKPIEDKIEPDLEAIDEKPENGDTEGLFKVVDDIPVTMWMAAIISGGERLAWYGATENYLQNDRNSALPGALGLQENTATLIMAAFFAVSYFAPIPGAILADAWLGRFWTIVVSAIIMLIASIILLVTSLPSSIQNPPTSAAGLVVTMVLFAFGSGFLRAAVSPFIADQYTNTVPRIKLGKNGERCITDREVTIQYVYNAYYWVTNVAGLGALVTTVLERYVGFWAAFILPLVGLSTSCVILFLYSKKFVKVPPVGTVLVNAIKSLVIAGRDGFRMDQAKPEPQLQLHGRTVPWDERFIDELKLALLACRIFLLFPFHWLALNQTFNNLISQAGQMVNYGVPNDAIKSINPISSVIIYPIIQKGLYPYLRRKNIPFRPISRITVGFILLAAAMAIAAGVQQAIYDAGPRYRFPRDCPASDGGHIPNQVNMFTQIPIYVLGGMAEIFCLPAVQELAYNQSPKSMRSLVAAISMAMAGVGSLIAMAFTPLAQNPYLVIMYSTLAGIMVATTVVFWVLFRNVDKKDLEVIE